MFLHRQKAMGRRVSWRHTPRPLDVSWPGRLGRTGMLIARAEPHPRLSRLSGLKERFKERWRLRGHGAALWTAGLDRSPNGERRGCYLRRRSFATWQLPCRGRDERQRTIGGRRHSLTLGRASPGVRTWFAVVAAWTPAGGAQTPDSRPGHRPVFDVQIPAARLVTLLVVPFESGRTFQDRKSVV